MLLAIDINNSYITIGVFSKDELLFVTEIASDKKLSCDQYAVELINVLKLNGANPDSVDGAIISSVVPSLLNIIKDVIHRLFSIKALVVGPGIKTGLHISIENPAQLGANIAACAVGALKYMKMPCVVCDFGTATTFTVLDSGGSLQGVIICPGITTSLDALTENTALLPHISIDTPKHVIGKNTIHSMQSGFVYGFASMVDGIISRVERELDMPVSIVVTGTMAQKIAPHSVREMKYNKYLLLEGLNKIYGANLKKTRFSDGEM